MIRSIAQSSYKMGSMIRSIAQRPYKLGSMIRSIARDDFGRDGLYSLNCGDRSIKVGYIFTLRSLDLPDRSSTKDFIKIRYAQDNEFVGQCKDNLTSLNLKISS